MRCMRQKIMDPSTVAEINAMRDWNVVIMDMASRNLGRLRDIVSVGAITMCLVYYFSEALGLGVPIIPCPLPLE
jgi:hypothetical protein